MDQKQRVLAPASANISGKLRPVPRPKSKPPADAVRALKDFERGFRKRHSKLTGDLEKLMEERDEAIRAAAANGMVARDIAAIVGVSHQRVSQIVGRRVR